MPLPPSPPPSPLRRIHSRYLPRSLDLVNLYSAPSHLCRSEIICRLPANLGNFVFPTTSPLLLSPRFFHSDFHSEEKERDAVIPFLPCLFIRNVFNTCSLRESILFFYLNLFIKEEQLFVCFPSKMKIAREGKLRNGKFLFKLE